jgi:hypothetical protein
LKLVHKGKLGGVEWIEMAPNRDFYEHSSETWRSVKGEIFLRQFGNLRKGILHKVNKKLKDQHHIDTSMSLERMI